MCLSTEIDSRIYDRDEREDDASRHTASRRKKNGGSENGLCGEGGGGGARGDCEDRSLVVARAALKRHNSNSTGSSKINQLERSISGY